MISLPTFTRRPARPTRAGAGFAAIAGCLEDSPTNQPLEPSTTQRTVAVTARLLTDGRLVVNVRFARADDPTAASPTLTVGPLAVGGRQLLTGSFRGGYSGSAETTTGNRQISGGY